MTSIADTSREAFNQFKITGRILHLFYINYSFFMSLSFTIDMHVMHDRAHGFIAGLI